MGFIHDNACKCITNNLDLFTVPPMQKSIENGKYIDYHPINTITDGSPIKFGSVQLSMLCVKVNVMQANGQNLPADAQVTPVNLFLYSLFSQLDLESSQWNAGNDCIGHVRCRSYIEMLLLYGLDAKKLQLTSSLYYKDDAGIRETANGGIVWRNQFIRQSRLVDMIGCIHADLFFQERYLLNEVNVKIKLIRSRDQFSLMRMD